MKKTLTISISTLIIAAVAFFIGYMVGRSWEKEPTESSKTEVAYKQSKYEVHDTISYPEPYDFYYETEKYIHDTIQSFIPQVVDTAKILADYYLTRKYKFDT